MVSIWSKLPPCERHDMNNVTRPSYQLKEKGEGAVEKKVPWRTLICISTISPRPTLESWPRETAQKLLLMLHYTQQKAPNVASPVAPRVNRKKINMASWRSRDGGRIHPGWSMHLLGKCLLSSLSVLLYYAWDLAMQAHKEDKALKDGVLSAKFPHCRRHGTLHETLYGS